MDGTTSSQSHLINIIKQSRTSSSFQVNEMEDKRQGMGSKFEYSKTHSPNVSVHLRFSPSMKTERTHAHSYKVLQVSPTFLDSPWISCQFNFKYNVETLKSDNGKNKSTQLNRFIVNRHTADKLTATKHETCFHYLFSTSFIFPYNSEKWTNNAGTRLNLRRGFKHCIVTMRGEEHDAW